MDEKPYSYRVDPSVPPFDDSSPLIIFDGHCVLCSSGVQWMLRHDPNGDCRFAAAQDLIPGALYRHYGLDPVAFKTFMVLSDGTPKTHWRGLGAAASLMPAPWKWLGAVSRIVPRRVGDRIYDWVQRNRFNWFGSRETCFLPSASETARFLRLEP